MFFSIPLFSQHEIRFIDSCFSSISYEGRKIENYKTINNFITGTSKSMVLKISDLIEIKYDSIYGYFKGYSRTSLAIDNLRYKLNGYHGIGKIVSLDPFDFNRDKSRPNQKGYLALKITNKLKKNTEYSLVLTFLFPTFPANFLIKKGEIEIFTNSYPSMEGAVLVGSMETDTSGWSTQKIIFVTHKSSNKWILITPRVDENVKGWSDKICVASPCMHLNEILIDNKVYKLNNYDSALYIPFVIHNLTFETNRSEILSVSFEELNKLADYLSEHLKYKIEISGHTDNRGKDEDNLKLSEERAKSVADYLINKGITKERISYKGFGSTKPITTNDTEEGRLKNRRVEFKISE